MTPSTWSAHKSPGGEQEEEHFLTRPWHGGLKTCTVIDWYSDYSSEQQFWCRRTHPLHIMKNLIINSTLCTLYLYIYLYKVARTLPRAFVKKKGFKNQNKINVRFCTRFNDCTVQIMQFREWKSGGGIAVTIYNTLRVHKWEAENSQ